MNFFIALKKSIFFKLMVLLSMAQLTVGIVLGQSNHFPTTGNVGLGLTNPLAQLHMLRGAATPAYPSGNSRGDIHQLLSAGNNAIEIGNARGTNNRRAWILARHYDVGGFGTVLSTLHLQPGVGSTESYRGVGIGYPASEVIPAGTHLAVNGKVGIGTLSPSEMLEVNGTIKSKEINITAVGWPDYVFRSDFILMPISEVEEFIRENGHLPNIPKEAEVLANGVNLGEINAKLLEKVEELTLYLIEQRKELESQKRIIMEQSKNIELLLQQTGNYAIRE